MLAPMVRVGTLPMRLLSLKVCVCDSSAYFCSIDAFLGFVVVVYICARAFASTRIVVHVFVFVCMYVYTYVRRICACACVIFFVCKSPVTCTFFC